MTYYIGQIIPLEPQRPAQNGETEPTWYAFQTPPQKEVSAEAWFRLKGVESWFPTETRRRRLARGKRKFVEYEGKIVPRYIFARFTGRPQWDVLQGCKWLSRVVGVNGDPLPVSDGVMAQMAQVPQRLEAIRKAEAERRTIRAGDKVRVTGGVMEGWVVDVASVHAGIAKLILPSGLLGMDEAQAEVSRLFKIASA